MGNLCKIEYVLKKYRARNNEYEIFGKALYG